jgi:hypothetical protein
MQGKTTRDMVNILAPMGQQPVMMAPQQGMMM